MSKKKETIQTFDLADVRDEKVNVPVRGGELFAAIRKQVAEKLPLGKAVLVADLFPLIPALRDMKGSMRYNYLVNACKASQAFEFVTVSGRKFIGRKQ